MTNMKDDVEKAYALLKLERRIVGVKLVYSKEEFDKNDAVEVIAPISYCVAVKCATLGHSIKFTAATSGCKGSTRALGLKAPTEKFYDGTDGCNLGLYSSQTIAADVAQKMKICPVGTYGVIVKPIEKFENTPDVVLIISDSRTCMRIIQGYSYFYGIQDSFCLTGNQAVCVEGTVVPIMTQKINISMFCSGTRFLAKWKDTEVIVGVPYEKFSQTIEGIRLTVNAVEMDERKKEIMHKLEPLGYPRDEIKLGTTYYLKLEEEKKKRRRSKENG